MQMCFRPPHPLQPPVEQRGDRNLDPNFPAIIPGCEHLTSMSTLPCPALLSPGQLPLNWASLHTPDTSGCTLLPNIRILPVAMRKHFQNHLDSQILSPAIFRRNLVGEFALQGRHKPS